MKKLTSATLHRQEPPSTSNSFSVFDVFLLSEYFNVLGTFNRCMFLKFINIIVQLLDYNIDEY